MPWDQEVTAAFLMLLWVHTEYSLMYYAKMD